MADQYTLKRTADPAFSATATDVLGRRSSTKNIDLQADAILQTAIRTLDGPHGADALNVVVGLSAVAGRWAHAHVRKSIASGHLVDDMTKPTNIHAAPYSISDHVTRLVCDLKDLSFASVLTTRMIASGADWLPSIERDNAHCLMSMTCKRFPVYSVPLPYTPEPSPHVLLQMLWQPMQNVLHQQDQNAQALMASIGSAVVSASVANRHKVPLKVAGQVALETAIAISKIDVDGG